MTNFLQLDEICKSYNNKLIIDQLSHKFFFGCHWVKGSNGIGKSTLLRLLSGVEAPSSGSIQLNEASLSSQPIQYKAQMGYAPDRLTAFVFLTVFEFLRFILTAKKTKSTEFLEQLIQAFNLQPFLQVQLAHLSLGNQKKVLLTAAFCSDPLLLILDEPYNELDHSARQFLTEYLHEVKKQKIVIFSSHDDFVGADSCLDMALISV